MTTESKTLFNDVLESKNKILRVPDMLALLHVSEATLHRLRKLADFPKSFKLSPRLIAWLASDVDAYITARHAAANGSAA